MADLRLPPAISRWYLVEMGCFSTIVSDSLYIVLLATDFKISRFQNFKITDFQAFNWSHMFCRIKLSIIPIGSKSIKTIAHMRGDHV